MEKLVSLICALTLAVSCSTPTLAAPYFSAYATPRYTLISRVSATASVSSDGLVTMSIVCNADGSITCYYWLEFKGEDGSYNRFGSGFNAHASNGALSVSRSTSIDERGDYCLVAQISVVGKGDNDGKSDSDTIRDYFTY